MQRRQGEAVRAAVAPPADPRDGSLPGRAAGSPVERRE